MDQQYSMNQPATSNSDSTTFFYSMDQPATPHNDSTTFFNPALAMLHTQELMHALTKEQEAVKVLKRTIKKREKTNKDLKEANTKMLETNKKLDTQMEKYHKMFILQLPNHRDGYQKGYQAGLAEWKNNSKSIRLKAITELTDKKEVQKSQKSQKQTIMLFSTSDIT